MAQIIINTSPAQDQRLTHCFGVYLSLGRDATGAEVKRALTDWMEVTVRRVEADEKQLQYLQGYQPPPPIDLSGA
jgi:hypothetical protein